MLLLHLAAQLREESTQGRRLAYCTDGGLLSNIQAVLENDMRSVYVSLSLGQAEVVLLALPHDEVASASSR